MINKNQLASGGSIAIGGLLVTSGIQSVQNAGSLEHTAPGLILAGMGVAMILYREKIKPDAETKATKEVKEEV